MMPAMPMMVRIERFAEPPRERQASAMYPSMISPTETSAEDREGGLPTFARLNPRASKR